MNIVANTSNMILAIGASTLSIVLANYILVLSRQHCLHLEHGRCVIVATTLNMVLARHHFCCVIVATTVVMSSRLLQSP